jgi:hypothetical protein
MVHGRRPPNGVRKGHALARVGRSEECYRRPGPSRPKVKFAKSLILCAFEAELFEGSG